ncbi:hypothetical protein RUND412_003068 [Rhizina undulata]
MSTTSASANPLSIIPLPTPQTHPAAYAATVKLIICNKIFPAEISPGGRWHSLFKTTGAFDPERGIYDTAKVREIVEKIVETQVLAGGLLERLRGIFVERERIKVAVEGGGEDVLGRRVVQWLESVRKELVFGAYNCVVREINSMNQRLTATLPAEKRVLVPFLNPEGKVSGCYLGSVGEAEHMTEAQVKELNRQYGWVTPMKKRWLDPPGYEGVMSPTRKFFSER